MGAAGGEREGMNREYGAVGGEHHAGVVLERGQRLGGDSAVIVGERAVVVLRGSIELDCCLQVMKVGGNGDSLVVVIDLAGIHVEVADGEIEDRVYGRCRTGLGGMREVRAPLCIDKGMQNWPVEDKLLEIDLALPNRQDLHADAKTVAGEEWRASFRGRAQSKIVEIDFELAPVDHHFADTELRTSFFLCLLDNFAGDETIEGVSVNHDVAGDNDDNYYCGQREKCVTNAFFRGHSFIPRAGLNLRALCAALCAGRRINRPSGTFDFIIAALPVLAALRAGLTQLLPFQFTQPLKQRLRKDADATKPPFLRQIFECGQPELKRQSLHWPKRAGETPAPQKRSASANLSESRHPFTADGTIGETPSASL